MSNIQKLSALIQSLEESGDSTRLFAARAAYNFKHSWLEMAQALVEVRNSGRSSEWGYESFFDYCYYELGLKRAIVDKLTVSFMTLQQHAPERLDSPSDNAPIPSYQALDYYARAVGEPRLDGNIPRDAPDEPLSAEMTTHLHHAVFEEGASAKELKERFEPFIRPKPPARLQHEAAKKALGTSHRLLDQLNEVEGLDSEVVRTAEQAVTNLQNEMEVLVETLREILVAEQDRL